MHRALPNTPFQLRDYALKKDTRKDRTLLQLSGFQGNKNTFDAVWGACRELGLKASEVPTELGRCCRHSWSFAFHLEACT